MTKKKVTIIEPMVLAEKGKKKLHVCAYARVSTGSDEQKDSFINQKKYYETMIKANPDFNFSGVFADEAISGTTDKRPNFQRMIALAEQNLIDVIYTKSISRFSRNVADLLKYCNLLKDHGVDVVFEENGLRLLDTTGSLMLTILGAIAQMEVENTSDHVNWTLQKKMESGQLVGQAAPLGYDVVENHLVINEDEAEIVKYIFRRYLEGIGSSRIAKELQDMGAKTKRGNTSWNTTTVLGIIKNEKYTGVLLQGKTYTVNPIGHVRKDNKGQVRSYRTEDHHDAIISLEDWKKAQEITDSRCLSYADGRRRGTTKNYQFNVFTSKIVCAYCGKHYVRRKVHAGTKYEKVVWDCSTKCKCGKDKCPHSKPIEEDFIKQSVVMVTKDLIDDTDSIFYLSNGKLNDLLKQSSKNKGKIEEQIAKCKRNVESKKKKKVKLLDLLLDDTITDEEYNSRLSEVNKEIESTQNLLNELASMVKYEEAKCNSSSHISKMISEGKAECFSEELFNYIIDRIVIGGQRSDGIDDPRSLHYELNTYNLCTDMIVKVDENGVLRYTMDRNIEGIVFDEGNTDSLCSSYKYDSCGVRDIAQKR